MSRKIRRRVVLFGLALLLPSLGTVVSCNRQPQASTPTNAPGATAVSAIIAVVHATTWPIALNTDTGFGTINPTILMVGRNLGLDRRRQISDVMLPAALPSILTGILSAWAFGWRTVVAAELVFGVAGSTAGLGWYINDSRYYLKTPNVFAGLVVIALLGILLDSVFLFVEQRTVEQSTVAHPPTTFRTRN